MLFHNAALHTPEALPGIIDELISEGYVFKPVSQSIYYGDCRIDANGCQWPDAPEKNTAGRL